MQAAEVQTCLYFATTSVQMLRCGHQSDAVFFTEWRSADGMMHDADINTELSHTGVLFKSTGRDERMLPLNSCDDSLISCGN